MTAADTVANARPPAAAAGRRRLALFGVALLALLGLVLRLAAARGELWLDEIWSLDLVAPLTAPWQVFYAVSHDNNHFLNGFWLALVGPDHDPLLLRAFSVALGTATVVAAGHLGLRHGPTAALVTAALFAVAYPMVHYGSEARGYAGLILATVVALDAMLRALDQPAPVHRYVLGAAIGFGTLAHLTMVIPAGVLAIAAFVHYRQARGSLRAAIEPTLVLFRPAQLAVLPTLAAFVAGILVTGRFLVGGARPFDTWAFVDGYGGILAVALGLPAGVPLLAVVAATVIAVVAAVRLDRATSPAERAVWLIGIVAVPALMFAVRLGNTFLPRYFLFAGVFLLAAIGIVSGRAIAAGGWPRIVAALGLTLLLLGQADALRRFFVDGRGGYEAIVARMGAGGPTTFWSNQPFANGMVVRHYAKRRGLLVTEAPADAGCDVAIPWYLSADPDGTVPPARFEVEAPGCTRRFVREMETPFWGLSGWRWTLYRADGVIPAGALPAP